MIWDIDSGYYCLTIAILRDLDVAEAKQLYKYGPGHPVCKKFLERKEKKDLTLETLKKMDTAKQMTQMRKCGYTYDEISDAFSCYPSTVRRKMLKAEETEKK